ncbi:PCI domain-containing protein [Blastocladiella britannica]|nr:PCI domain-containing protein [Blastocladiella britannica]
MTVPSSSPVAVADAAAARGDLPAAVKAYQQIVAADAASEEAVRAKEHAVLRLGQLLRDQGAAADLAALQTQARPFLISLPKAKTAKIVRTLIDYLSEIPNSLDLQVAACKSAIDWAEAEKRAFLRQALETRLAAMYLDNKMYTESLALIASLLRELKRLDDKAVLVDVQLLESRVWHALRNIPKARAALTSARTSANSIYCPPLMQAALDLQSGVLHAEEKDFKTAFSYFYETLEGYSSQDDARAVLALKYMLLCKIMLSLPDDVTALLTHKVANKYTAIEVDAMKAIATAMQQRSLLDFERSLTQYKAQLHDDPVVRLHLSTLYDTLLEQNLVKVIEPYARVEVAHVAEMVKLPVAQVEQKLSQLILDGKIKGVLDQGVGILVIFDEVKDDATYTAAIDTIKKMGTVVDALYQKAATLS